MDLGGEAAKEGAKKIGKQLVDVAAATKISTRAATGVNSLESLKKMQEFQMGVPGAQSESIDAKLSTQRQQNNKNIARIAAGIGTLVSTAPKYNTLPPQLRPPANFSYAPGLAGLPGT
jgi:hypothetical protein